MELVIFGWLPVLVGVALMTWMTFSVVRTRKWWIRVAQSILLLLVFLATLGQLLMVMTPSWPTYLYMMILAICSALQVVMHLAFKKL